MTANIVTDPDHLRWAVEKIRRTPQVIFDGETRPGMGVKIDEPPGTTAYNEAVKFYSLNPRTNEVYWLSLASLGVCVAIPMGHPNGEQIGWRPAPLRPGTKTTKRVLPKFAPPPPQMEPMQVFDICKPLFFDPDIIKVNHNVKFDLLSIAKYYGEVPSPPYADTVVQSQLLDENRPLDLGALVNQHFRYKYDKIGKNLQEYSFERAGSYSWTDAKYDWLLYRHNLPRLAAEDLSDYWAFECDITEVLTFMEWHGAPVRDDEVGDLDVFLRGEMERTQAELWSEAGREFELTKPSEKGWFIFDHCKHEPWMFTAKRKEPSLAKEHLESFTADARVNLLMEYERLAKWHSTYVLNFSKYSYKGRIHANFKQAGTVTGRFSCVTGSTLLPTSRGVFRFDEYKPEPGDLVRTHTGSLQPVVRKGYLGQKLVRRVCLSNGSVLECADEHRVMTPTGWRYACDLVPGDEVVSYVGVEVVRDGWSQHPPSTQHLLRAEEADAGTDRTDCWYDLPQRALHRSDTLASRTAEGREGVAVLALEDGRGEPDARHDRVEAPQLSRRRRCRRWVSEEEGRSQVLPGTSDCDRRGVGDSGELLAVVSGGASHRRGQGKQLTGQSGIGHTCWASAPTCQTVTVREVTPLGAMGVWDIEVAGDHSYLTQGFIHHNCGEPNLQNVPKPETEVGKKLRGLFWGGREDFCLVVGDYSQIELRVLAYYSNDPTMVQAFVDGEDIHQASANTLGCDRGIAKNINFAIPFGAGYKKVAAMGGGTFSLRTAKRFYNKHKEDFPTVWEFINTTRRRCRREKPHQVHTILGRKRRLPQIVWVSSNDERLQSLGAKAERQAVNTRIQGSAADLIKLAMVRVHDMLDDDQHLILQIHDELVVVTPRDKADDCLSIMREAMEGDEMQILTNPDGSIRVPVTANIKIVERWADAK